MSDHILGLMATQIWQIAALAIVVAVVVKLAAKNRPHLAHALWVLVLIKCVTPPLWGHSLGVFSQLQAWIMPDETASLTDVSNLPASVPVAMAEILAPAMEIDVPDPEHGQPETYEPDELLSLASREPPEDTSLMWDGGTGIELDEAAQRLDKQEANIAYAEPVLPVERVESDAGWLRHTWILLSGLAAGAIITLFIMVIRCLRCLREIHRHRTTEFDDQLCERVQQLSRHLRVRRIPQIIVSDVLFGPAVLGLLRHTIVLPRCLFENAEGVRSRSFLPERTFAVRRTAQGQTSAQRQSDAVESASSGRVAASREVPPGRRDLPKLLPGREDLLFLDPILAHELLHIRRGDLRTGTLQAIVQSLWWFHPAVWLSNRWLSREAERCCDEQVIAELGCSPAQYARSLLSVIECKHQLQPIPVFPGMKPVEITTQRMERIMSLRNGLRKQTPISCWVMIAALAIIVLPGAVAETSVDEPEAEPTSADSKYTSERKVQIKQRTFEGNRFWSNGDLRKHLVSKEAFLIFREIYNPDTMPADIEALKAQYQKVGFFDVEVTGQPLFSRDRSDVNLHFKVTEGRRYQVREIRYEGNNRIGSSDLQEGSIVKPGDKFSGFEIAKDIKRIRDRYIGLGLEPVVINPVPHFGEEIGVVDVVFEIDEGLTALIRLDDSFIPSPDMVLTAKAKDQPVVETPEPASLRIPVLPIPEYVNKSTDPLVKLVWDAREASRRRLMMTDQPTPWQFMNGLAALRRDFLIRQGDEAVAGLDWLQNGQAIPGEPWFQKTKHGGQPDPKPAPIWFDDHAQQFVATLAMNDVPLDAKFATADGPITMGDMIMHLQMTVTEKRVPPWTLIALIKYLPPDAEWVKTDGERWSIERVLRRVLDGPSPENSTNSLVALAFARDQYLRTGRPLQGVWLEAQDKIGDVIRQPESRSTAVGRIRPVIFRSPRFPRRTYGHVQLVSPPFPASQGDVLAGQYFGSAGQTEIYSTASSYDFNKTPGQEMLLFCVAALPEKQLQEDWLRNAIEVGANELLADWANTEIRSPFYETTQALSIYLERIATAGSLKTTSETTPFTVQVNGLVRNPGVYQASADKDLRVTDAIQLAGGAVDESADKISVIRKAGKSPQLTILQVNLQSAKRGADPNFFLSPGDEVLLQAAEFVTKPLATGIRLDESFVMSPDAPITGNTVIVFVNDRPITVEKFIGSGWERLEKTPGVTELLKRRIALESIAAGLPEFVYQELVLQYFNAEVPKLHQEVSPKQREVTDKKFVETLEKLPKTDADPRTQAQFLAAALSIGSVSEMRERAKFVDGYVRGLHDSSIASNKSAVVRHVQELVTTARLRSLVSLDFENTSLSEVIRSLAKNHGINIVVKSLHVVTGSRLSARPATVTYHGQDQSLGDAINAIVDPFGLCMKPAPEAVTIELADYEGAMEEFRSLPGPPSFAVFGIVKNTGWQLLDKEIRLLDAITLAGGIADSDGVTIEITNPEIMSGNALPVSMSLRVLQNDESGKLNRIVKDGDMISVTRNGSADALPAKESGAGVMNGKGVNGDAGLAGTVRFDQPSNVADDENSAATSDAQDNVSGRYDGPPTPELIREPRLYSPDKLLVPERPMPPAIQQSSDPLVKLVWEARESSRRRLLTTDQHTPWQLMHGLLGLRQDFVVNHNGRIINGLEWIQSGPTFKDEPPFQEDQPWFQKTKHGGRAHPYLRPYLFEGHINQFAAILASCRLPLNAQFGTPVGPITMQDLITNAQMTANEKEEVSWTLSLLSRYLPPDAKWGNAKGEGWSIERLVKVEVGKTLDGPCGGTCGLFALAVARNEYLRSGKPLEGVWLEADQKVRRYMHTVRLQQDPNGTLSSKYFRGREYKQDFDKRLASSGALLQFLMMAASDEQLKEDWLRRAVEATANDLMTNRKALVSCSPLFETTNALSIYLDRVLLSEQIASLPSPLGNNLAGPRPQSEIEKPKVSVPTMVAIYPVADLVVPIRNVVAKVASPVDAARAADSATAVVPNPDSGRTSDDRFNAHGGSEELLNIKADFAPLTELIKATVQPDSWERGLAIQVEEKTLSLIIQQTEKAHQEIAELLSQLRNAQGQNVQIPCLVVHLTKESQTKWLEEQCSLHSLAQGSRWALLPQQRCESFTQALLEQKPEVLSRPVVRTISGQTATIAVGQLAVGGTPTIGIRLEVTPHVLPDSNVIRLHHSFSIGEFANEMPQPIESLVGSGQTLLLLIDDPENKEKPDAARSQYLLMMTPEHIPQIEEEQDVSTANPVDSASAVDPADSPDK